MAKKIYLVEHTASMENETDFFHHIEMAFEDVSDALNMLDTIKRKVEEKDYPPLAGEKPVLVSDGEMIRTDIVRGLKYKCVGRDGRVMYARIFVYPTTLI